MKSVVFLLISITLLVNSIFAQEPTKTLREGLSVCPFQLGERGKNENFRFSSSYIVVVAEGGEITKINEMESAKINSATKFVRDDLFIDCIKKWKPKTIGSYFVRFVVGTSSKKIYDDLPLNFMMVYYPDSSHPSIIEIFLKENDKQ
jgi:hypothetical protein